MTPVSLCKMRFGMRTRAIRTACPACELMAYDLMGSASSPPRCLLQVYVLLAKFTGQTTCAATVDIPDLEVRDPMTFNAATADPAEAVTADLGATPEKSTAGPR